MTTTPSESATPRTNAAKWRFDQWKSGLLESIKELDGWEFCEVLEAALTQKTAEVAERDKLIAKLSTTPSYYIVPGYEDCSGSEILEIIEEKIAEVEELKDVLNCYKTVKNLDIDKLTEENTQLKQELEKYKQNNKCSCGLFRGQVSGWICQIHGQQR